MIPNTGLAFHPHHDTLVEYCYNFVGRVEYIKKTKPLEEQGLRLRLFKMIPVERLPPELSSLCADIDRAYTELNSLYAEVDRVNAELDRVWDEHVRLWAKRDKARAELDRVRANLDKAILANMPALTVLHAELCPDCPWNGKSIFN